MDKRFVNQIWEKDYIIERVMRVSEAMETDNYECALVMLQMIQDKAGVAASHIVRAKSVIGGRMKPPSGMAVQNFSDLNLSPAEIEKLMTPYFTQNINDSTEPN